MCWDYEIDNNMEHFSVENGINATDLLKCVLARNNKATYIPGKVVISWFYPILETVFNSLDMMDVVIRFIPKFVENYLPGTVCKRVRKTKVGKSTLSYFVYIHDVNFEEYLNFNFDLCAVEQFKAAPCMFGLPAIQTTNMLSDCRDPFEIVWIEKDKPQKVGDYLIQDGRTIGKFRSSNDFYKFHKLDLSEFEIPEENSVEILEDYFCPLRKRVVLHKGCIYLAPFYACTICHDKASALPKQMLK